MAEETQTPTRNRKPTFVGPKYRVMTSLLDRIEHAAGFDKEDRPKRIVEHYQGDTIRFEQEAHDDGTVEKLLSTRAIVDDEKERKRELAELESRRQALQAQQDATEKQMADNQSGTVDQKETSESSQSDQQQKGGGQPPSGAKS